MDSTKIGKLISELRKKKGYTQTELANLLETDYRMISKWERGTSLPDIIYYPVICKTLNITLEELLNGRINTHKRKMIFLNHLINIFIIILLLFLVPITIFLSSFYKQEHNSFKLYSINSNNMPVAKVSGIVIRKNNRYLYLYNIDAVTTNFNINIYDDNDLIFSTNKATFMFSLNYLISNNSKLIIDFEDTSYVYQNKIIDDTNNLLNDNYVNNNFVSNNYDSQSYFEENSLTTLSAYYNQFLNSIDVVVIEKNNPNVILEKYTYYFNNQKLICEVGICSSYQRIISKFANLAN